MPLNYVRPIKGGGFPLVPEGLNDVSLGNGTQHEIYHTMTDRGLFVGVVGKGCYYFNHPTEFGYVMEKLKLHPYNGDAMNISDYINAQLGCPTIGGHYQENLCQ